MSLVLGAVAAEGVAIKHEVEQILTELNDAAADCETVMSSPRIFQVWGNRAIVD